MRSLLLVIHILGAGAWIGANATQIVVTPMVSRMGGSTAAVWMRATVTMGRVLYTPAAILSLLTGIGLVLNSAAYDFEQLFVVIGFVMVIVGAVLGARVFGPGGEKAAAAFEAGDKRTARTQVVKVTRFGLLDSTLLVITITAMVMRWGA